MSASASARRAEVVDGADEVVEVGAAELLDLGLRSRAAARSEGEQRLGRPHANARRTNGPRSSPAAMAVESCARSASDAAADAGASPGCLRSIEIWEGEEEEEAVAELGTQRRSEGKKKKKSRGASSRGGQVVGGGREGGGWVAAGGVHAQERNAGRGVGPTCL